MASTDRGWVQEVARRLVHEAEAEAQSSELAAVNTNTNTSANTTAAAAAGKANASRESGADVSSAAAIAGTSTSALSSFRRLSMIATSTAGTCVHAYVCMPVSLSPHTH